MNTFHLYLSNLPRKLHFPAPLLQCAYYTDAIGGGTVTRGHTFEIAIRLNSQEDCAVDIVQGNEYRNPFPHIIIRPPEMTYISKLRSPREVFFMIFPETAMPFLKEIGFKTDFTHLKLPAPNLVLDCARDIEALRGQLMEKGTADRIDLRAFQLLSDIFLSEDSPEETGYYDAKIIQIASELRQAFREKIDFDNLFHQYGLSRRTFFRYWSKHFTLSPKAYVEEIRFQESIRLLTETTLSISDIAQQLPYPNVSYFCKHFKQRFHQTPLQFRQQNNSLG